MILGCARHLAESTAFTLLIAVLAVGLRKHGAASRHTLWLVAAAKFVVPMALFASLGTHLHTLIPTSPILTVDSGSLSRMWFQRSTPPVNMEAPAAVRNVLLALWLAGALAMFAIWVRRLLAPDEPAAPASDCEDEALVRTSQRLGIRRPVKLQSSSSKIEPVLSGIWRPIITIPHGLSKTLKPGELDAVLLHELAHAQRRDNLFGALMHALVCVFWFYPIVWWIERRLIVERELACDEMVILHGAPPEEYVSGILKVCRAHFADALPGMCGITGSDLKNRMELIMSFPSRDFIPHAPRVLLGVLATAITLLPMAAGFFEAPTLYAETKNQNRAISRSKDAQVSLKCILNGVNYLEGAVVQFPQGPEQMCVRDFYGKPLWVNTTRSARERSSNVIALAALPATLCEPRPSSSQKFCSCQNGEYSIGAIVKSATGKLRCAEGKWLPETRTEPRLR